MSPDVPGKGPVDETMRQRVHAIAQEAYRRRLEQTHPGHDIDAPTVILAIEIALSGWTPPEPEPEPVDPDVLAFREWAANDHEADAWTGGALLCRLGRHDDTEEARAYLAGARMAREQERERAKVLEAYVKLDEHGPHLWTRERARKVLAKYRGEA